MDKRLSYQVVRIYTESAIPTPLTGTRDTSSDMRLVLRRANSISSSDITVFLLSPLLQRRSRNPQYSLLLARRLARLRNSIE